MGFRPPHTPRQAILSERGSLPLLEIAVEARAGGYRPGEPAQLIVLVLRSTMKYHRDQVVKIGEKWWLA